MGEKKPDYYDPRFCGTDKYTLYSPFGPTSMGLKLTDSVVYFAEQKSAYWTIDVVYSYLPEMLKYMKEHDTNIVFLHFDVADGKCEFYAQLDSGKPKFITQSIEYTDLDVPVMFYLQNEVLMFPSDY